jgi:hypothetical protein
MDNKKPFGVYPYLYQLIFVKYKKNPQNNVIKICFSKTVLVREGRIRYFYRKSIKKQYVMDF